MRQKSFAFAMNNPGYSLKVSERRAVPTSGLSLRAGDEDGDGNRQCIACIFLGCIVLSPWVRRWPVDCVLELRC